MRVKGPSAQTVERNLWASPVCFVLAAFICFSLAHPTGSGDALAWKLYAVGWAPPLVALVWILARGRYPGAGAVFALLLLSGFGGLFWLVHG